jgi:hypothetical protein
VAEDVRAVSRFRVVRKMGKGENILWSASLEVCGSRMGTDAGVRLSNWVFAWVFAWNRRGSVSHDKIHDFAHAAFQSVLSDCALKMCLFHVFKIRHVTIRLSIVPCP